MDMGFNDTRAFEGNDSAQGLRPLGWSELCARLAAAQELRRLAAPGGDVPDEPSRVGSFHHPAALLLKRDGPIAGKEVEGPVNPNPSASGNHGASTQGANENTPPHPSRAALIRRELP